MLLAPRCPFAPFLLHAGSLWRAEAVCLVALVISAVCCLANDAAAAPVLGPGSAAVAYRPPGETNWHIASPDWNPQEAVAIRSSAHGTRTLRLGESRLTLGPLTDLQLDAGERRITLHSGKVHLRVGGEQAWSIVAGDRKATLAPSAAALLVADRTGLTLGLISGHATLHEPGGAERKVEGPSTARLAKPSEGQGGWKTKAWSETERQRELAWLGEADAGQGLGQLLIQDAQADSPVRLNVARYHVNVVLKPPVALVQIDQSFYNPYTRQEQGTFVFNLPTGASVSRFAMYVTPTRLIEGELIERREARRIYDTIVSRRRDPAILEQIGDNLFRMQVFPVFARDTKRILLDYTVPLEGDEGAYHFRLPLLSDLKPIWDFRIQGVIGGGEAVAEPHSVSHPEMEFARGDEDDSSTVRFEWSRTMFDPTSDFIVSFRQPVENEAAVRTFRAEPLEQARSENENASASKAPRSAGGAPGLGGTPGSGTPSADPSEEKQDDWSNRPVTYFQASLPPLAQDEASQPAPADVLILTDLSSGSFERRSAIRRALHSVVRNLRDQDRFRLAGLHVTARPLADGWQAAGDAAAQGALEAWDEQVFLGATDLNAAFEALAGVWDDSDRRRVVVYIGDGKDTAEQVPWEELPERLAASLKEQRAEFAAVDVANESPGSNLLKALAEGSGGYVFDGTRRSGLDNLFRWTLRGMPRPLRIRGVTTTLVPPDDLFHDTAWLPWQTPRILGRTAQPEEARLECVVSDGREERRHVVTFAGETGEDDVFLGRLWASRKLRQLLREDEQLGVEQNLKDPHSVRQRIIRLSRQWSLLSPFTAFLVLETEADYQRWGIDRQQRRRYWRPAGGWTTEPLPETWLRLVQPDSSAGEPRVAATSPDRVESPLREARQAIERREFQAALDQLDGLTVTEEATRRRIAALRQVAADGAARRQRIARLLEQQPLFQLEATFEPSRASILPLLIGWSLGMEGSSPLAAELTRQVDFPSREMSLEQLAEWLEDAADVPVLLNDRALEDYGLDRKTTIKPVGSGRLSIGSCVEFLLRQADLYLIEEPDCLRITTEEDMERRARTRVVPLDDLLISSRVAPLEKLVAGPRDELLRQRRQRLTQRLERPVTLELAEVPLREALERFREQFGEALLVDTEALDDEAVGMDAPVSVRSRQAPARAALARMLERLDLDFYIDHEAVIITTPEVAEEQRVPRVHSGRGVLVAWPIRDGEGLAAAGGGADGLNPLVPRMGWQGGFFGGPGALGGGGFGGGMGGGGFGGGGMGGGGVGGGFAGGVGPRGRGAFFGGGRAVSGASGASGESGMSSGGAGTGDELVEEQLAGEDEPAESEGEAASGAAASSRESSSANLAESAASDAGDRAASDAAMRYEVDSDTLIETITSTVEPSTWDEVGGPSSIQYFAPTLDLVVAGPERVQAAVEDLLRQLGRRPIDHVAAKAGARLAETPVRAGGDVPAADLQATVDLIQATVRPESWDVLGGPNSLVADPARLAVTVRADPVTHRQLDRLLAELRRSRYRAIHGTRPWEQGVESLLSGGLSQLDPRVTLDGLPEPAPDELELLAGRRSLEGQAQTWRRVEPVANDRPIDGNAASAERSWTIRLSRNGEQTEAVTPRQILRIVGDQATVAYPTLTLAETGRWAESARRRIDGWLPWLPHRDNRAIARLFDIRPLANSQAKGRKEEEQQERENFGGRLLRLTPAGLPPDGDTYLAAMLDTQTGQFVRIDVIRDGRRQGQLVWREAEPDTDRWERYELLDTAGRVRARWELTAMERDAEPAASSLPADAERWNDYVLLPSSDVPGVPRSPLEGVLEQLERRAWKTAGEELDRLLLRRPGQPLLLFLRAWTVGRQDAVSPRTDLVLADLRQVAASRAVGLTRAITAANFPCLSPTLLYDILGRQPPSTRGGEDWQRLARLALATQQLEACAEHARHSLRDVSDTESRAERTELLVEALLRMEKPEMAEEALNDWLGQAPSVARVASMLSLVGRLGQPALAERLLAGQLERELTANQRRQLVRVRADLHEGGDRWRYLLQAASLVPNSPDAAADLYTLLGELHRPEHAAVARELAAACDVPALRDSLRLEQARLTTDGKQAAELIWQVRQAGNLEPSQEAWAAQQWIVAGQPERAIVLLEDRLLEQGQLDDALRQLLGVAYDSVGREVDARRARSRDGRLEPVRPVALPGGFF